MKVLFLISHVLVILALAASAQELKDRGRALFDKGDFAGAIDIFEKAVKQPDLKKDADVWNSLGLSYLNSGESKKARGALEKAVSLAPDKAAYHANLAFAYLMRRQLEKSQAEVQKALALDPGNSFANYIVAVRRYWAGELDEAGAIVDAILLRNPNFSSGYLLKAEVFMSKLGKRLRVNFKIRQEIGLLRSAVEALEAGQKNTKNAANLAAINERLEALRWFHDFYSRGQDPDEAGTPATAPPSVDVKPLKILRQPAALYTEDAREVGATGAVRLAIHLGANGQVLHILKLWGIGYGLDEQAIKAAKAIKFEPKTVGGKPVSVVVIREYTFSIY